MGYKLDFHGHTTEESILKAIKKKEDLSFVIAYQLLTEDQEKKRQHKGLPERDRAKIFSEVTNALHKEEQSESVWEYGRTYHTSARDLARRVIEVLGKMNTQYFIKCTPSPHSAQDYKIKCTYIPHRMTSANSFGSVDNNEADETLLDGNEDKEFEDKLPKFTRKEITFSINIYEARPGEHLLDLQLNRGHSLIFMEYVDLFFDSLNTTFEH